MRRVNLILIILLLVVMIGCVRGKKQIIDDLITVDVTNSYFSKRKMILQDFMNVEYIVLETKDEFYNQGFVADIGEKILLVINLKNDWEIFVYSRIGKALRKINRKGQGGEEYTYISNIILDEDNNEMYVHDHHIKKILVYDLYGVFKRSFNYRENTNGMLYTDIDNYDKNTLICFDEYNDDRAFVLISKQDGHIVKKIDIPVGKTKLLIKFLRNKANQTMLAVRPDPYRTIIPFNNDKVLLEFSSDTIYIFSPDYSLRPFIVRTPSVQSMDPEIVLIIRMLTDRYCFMETIKNEYDFNSEIGFSKTYLMYDKQENEFYGYAVYNADYLTKKEIYMSVLKPVNHENELWQHLEAYQLVESYRKGELTGKLKEIAAKLNEDSNPVIMLVKHKNKPNL